MSRYSSNILFRLKFKMVHFLHVMSSLLLLHVAGAVANTIPRGYNGGSSYVGTSMFGRVNCASGTSKL